MQNEPFTRYETGVPWQVLSVSIRGQLSLLKNINITIEFGDITAKQGSVRMENGSLKVSTNWNVDAA